MTREQKIAKARKLRAKGWTYREIGDEMDACVQTVQQWLTDPDLSRLRARKASYAGTCEACGGPTHGSNGRDKAPKVCRGCLSWTDEEIIDAIRAWADAHNGEPPVVQDWWCSSETHPVQTVVTRRMGWNEALLRAGFGLVRDCRPETQEWIEDQIRAGVPVREIAGTLGVTNDTIYKRLRYRGLRMADLRSAA